MQQVYIGTTAYGRHWLDAPAAASWLRMVRDGCPSGGITDAGRTQAEQETLFRKHFTTNYAASAKFDRRVWNGQTWYRAYQPGGKKPWPSAATPGSPQARHQWGLSLDLNGSTKAWVRANGHRYGWIKDVVPGEDWHMEYQAGRDAVRVSNPVISNSQFDLLDPDSTAIKALVPKHQGETMFLVKSIQTGTYWLVGPGFCHALTSMAQVTPFQAGGLKTVDLDDGDIGQIQAVCSAINSYTR